MGDVRPLSGRNPYPFDMDAINEQRRRDNSIGPVSERRPLPRFQEGQVFAGFAFGQAVTVTLSYPEWIDYAGEPHFWTWHATTHLGGGCTLSERVLADEFQQMFNA